MSESTLHPEALRDALRPFRLHWFPRLRSTNDHAAGMRRRGELFAPAVVLTGRQTAGRGRGGNAWWSGSGCLTVTFVFPVDDGLMPHHLPLLAGLAVRNAAAECSGSHDIRLKWPNDLLYDGRKLAGLLCERVEKADLVGLGLNVNLDPATAPPDLAGRVASLSEAAGRPLDVNDVLASVAGQLYRTWNGHRQGDQPFPAVLREYDAHHALVGRQVSVSDAGGVVSGRCEGLDEMGRLLLRSRGSPGKLQRVIAGHVQVI